MNTYRADNSGKAFMYDIGKIYEAHTVEEAVNLRLEHPEAVIIAGGSDVLIKVRSGKLAGADLISIQGVDELRGVHMEKDGTLVIGSLTSFSHITADPLIGSCIRVLGEAADKVGGPQIRAVGTVGGNTCNGVTSADTASTLLAYDAIVELAGGTEDEGRTGGNAENAGGQMARNPGAGGADGQRRIARRLVPLEKFYLGPGRTDVRPGEIQTCLRIPGESYKNHYGFYIKFGMRNAMEIATVGCSVNVKLSEDKKYLDDLRIAFGVAGPVPMRAHETEKKFKGAALTAQTVTEIGSSVLSEVHPRDSWRAPKNMRRHLCRTMTQDALCEAVRRAGGMIAGMKADQDGARDFMDITLFPDAGAADGQE